MKHLELFSGVGGFRKAMEYVSKDLHVPFVTIGFSEIDKNATKTYMANFDTQGETVSTCTVENPIIQPCGS